MRTLTTVLTAGFWLTWLLLAAACGGEPHGETARTEPPAIQAALATAQRLEVTSEIEIHGTVEAERSASLSTRVMAMVTAVRVAPGDTVRAGQVLVEVDPQAAEGQATQARGALAQARAALSLAERNLARFEALAESRSASELELDLARMQHQQALGAVEQAEGALAAAAAVASDSRVTAPFAGRVARKSIEVGDLAAPGRPLLTLESAAGRRLRLSVPESVMSGARLAAGDRLRVALDARPDLGSLEGTVVEAAPGADPATHSFEIKVALPDLEVASGGAGRAWVPTGAREVVAVPRAAVLRQGGMTLVVLRDENALTASRAVTVGDDLDGDRVEILSGLAGGETVLVGLAAVPPTGAAVEEPGVPEAR